MRRSARPHTLRGRIVLGTLLTLLVTFALVGVTTVLALKAFLENRLDDELTVASARYAQDLGNPDGDADDTDRFRSAPGQAAGTLGALVLDGRVVAAAVVAGHDESPRSVSASAQAVLAQLGASSTVREVHLPDIGEYRVLVVHGPGRYLLVTGLPDHPVRETVERLVVIEAVVFGVAIVLVGLATAAYVRRATRPLERVVDTAAAVAALPMGSGAVSIDTRAPVPREPDSEAGKVAVAVNRLLDEVEAALRERQASEDRLRRFVADASHELRTPVAVIRAHAEFAQRAGTSAPESLGRIQAEADRVGRLVDDLLLLARLDSGRPLARDEVDLTRIVLESVSDARLTGPQHQWRLALPDEPVTATGDELALRQVVGNLLTNVRVHTPPGTTARVTLEPGDPLTLTVADDGPGLPPAVADRVFDRFVRGDDERSAVSSSSGLGLAIVTAIVEAHGGTARVLDAPAGTAVRIVLPAAPAQNDRRG